MILIFQVLFVIFSVVALKGVYAKRKDGLLGPKGAIFWFLFWCAAVVAVVWPGATTIVANNFGIGRGTDFIIYISISAIFYLLFKLHIKVEAIGRDVTRVVRKDALESEINNNETMKQ